MACGRAVVLVLPHQLPAQEDLPPWPGLRFQSHFSGVWFRFGLVWFGSSFSFPPQHRASQGNAGADEVPAPSPFLGSPSLLWLWGCPQAPPGHGAQRE